MKSFDFMTINGNVYYYFCKISLLNKAKQEGFS